MEPGTGTIIRVVRNMHALYVKSPYSRWAHESVNVHDDSRSEILSIARFVRRPTVFGIRSPQKLHHLEMSGFASIRMENSARWIYQHNVNCSQIDGILWHFHNLTVDKAKELIDTALSLDLRQGEIEETSCTINGWLTWWASNIRFAGTMTFRIGFCNNHQCHSV